MSRHSTYLEPALPPGEIDSEERDLWLGPGGQAGVGLAAAAAAPGGRDEHPAATGASEVVMMETAWSCTSSLGRRTKLVERQWDSMRPKARAARRGCKPTPQQHPVPCMQQQLLLQRPQRAAL